MCIEGGLKWRTRCGVLVMWQVEPEPRIKEFFKGWSLIELAWNDAQRAALIVVTFRPSSHWSSSSSWIVGVGVCDFLIIGVRDLDCNRDLLCHLSKP